MIEFKMTCDMCGCEGHLSMTPSEKCIKALKEWANNQYGQAISATELSQRLQQMAYPAAPITDEIRKMFGL